MEILTIISIMLLVGVHILSYKLSFMEGTPRNIWLSFAGGASVSYVFLHLIPELSQGQKIVEHSVSGSLHFLEKHIYLIALIGLATFYGMEKMVNKSKRKNKSEGEKEQTNPGVFWMHIGAFALYNILIGYIFLNLEDTEVKSGILFTFAMSFHFLVNDFALKDHHKDLFVKYGRWVLAGAVLLGWLSALAIELSKFTLSIFIAFIAGGIVLNVLKEELPGERESRFYAFFAGVVFYSVLLIVME